MKHYTTTVITVKQIGELYTFVASDGYESMEFYDDQLSAADAAAKLAVNNPRFELHITDNLKDQLTLFWQCQGMALYKAGNPGSIWNRWQREGYDAAQNAGVGILISGWPTATSLRQCESCGALYDSIDGHTCRPTVQATRSWSGMPVSQSL